MTEKKKNNRLKGAKSFSVQTEARFLRISPRKLRLLANSVKKFSPQEAILRLRVWNKKGARLLRKAIQTVIADAENNFNLKKESLRFKEILVNEGPRLKRFDRFHGARFDSGVRKKRLAHLRVVILGTKEESKKEN